MPKYAEWLETKYGGRNNRIIKGISKQKREILDENELCFLVEDQEGPIWISKNSVKVIEDESLQVRNNISENTVDSEC